MYALKNEKKQEKESGRGRERHTHRKGYIANTQRLTGIVILSISEILEKRHQNDWHWIIALIFHFSLAGFFICVRISCARFFLFHFSSPFPRSLSLLFDPILANTVWLPKVQYYIFICSIHERTNERAHFVGSLFSLSWPKYNKFLICFSISISRIRERVSYCVKTWNEKKRNRIVWNNAGILGNLTFCPYNRIRNGLKWSAFFLLFHLYLSLLSIASIYASETTVEMKLWARVTFRLFWFVYESMCRSCSLTVMIIDFASSVSSCLEKTLRFVWAKKWWEFLLRFKFIANQIRMADLVRVPRHQWLT